MRSYSTLYFLPDLAWSNATRKHMVLPKLLTLARAVLCTGLAILCIASCTEPFYPEPTGNQRLLVVEGHVSDADEPNTIRLSRTMPLNSRTPAPESGARVTLRTKEGVAFEFVETAKGSYESDPACFIGQAGVIYTLHIETTDGSYYQSSDVMLKLSPPIDSVYFERERRFTDLTGEELDGVKILVDTHDDSNKARYYRYEWVASYQIKVPFPSQWEFGADGVFELVDYYSICYNSDTSKHILTINTVQLNDDRVSAFELNYINTISYRLRTAYSINVRQFTLDEQGYSYWNQLNKNSENLGTLFDPTPFPIIGNIHNTNDPDEVVLGYFDASTVEEKRLYITREKLDELELTFPTDPCILEADTVKGGYDEMLLRLSWGQRIITIPGIGGGALIMGPAECSDCRLLGNPDAPDFWQN
jgi:hypothetical protein